MFRCVVNEMMSLVVLCFSLSQVKAMSTPEVEVTPSTVYNTHGVGEPVYNETHGSHVNVKVNEAMMCINSSFPPDHEVSVYVVSDECHQCKPYILRNVTGIPYSAHIIVNTSFTTVFHIHNSSKTLCSCQEHFQDGGNYVMYLDISSMSSSQSGCMCNIDGHELPSPLVAVWAALAILVTLFIMYYLVVFLYHTPLLRRCCFCLDTERLVNSELGSPQTSTAILTATTTNITTRRLKSLDTFRGISIVMMIFVNYGGGEYWFFTHATWNGLTFADLVFPWFIFIMGVSLMLSLSAQQKRGYTKRKMFYKILSRSVILFCLGIMLNSHYKYMAGDLTKLRIPGVLQRFSISYFVVASVELIFIKQSDPHQFVWWSSVRDITDNWIQCVVMLLFLLLHVFITLLVKIPNCPKGYHGPGGIGDMEKYFNCTGGVARYIDSHVLGDNHIYQTPTIRHVYMTAVAYDPEGILGILTSIFLTFLGVQAGRILITYQFWKDRLIRWLLWAIVTGAVGTMLCWAGQDNAWIPVNKNLWSASFVCVTGSLGLVLLIACHYLCDVVDWWEGGPFFFAGMNSILLYCGHEIMAGYFPFYWYGDETHSSYLSCAIVGTLCWLAIAYYCFRVKFFLKV